MLSGGFDAPGRNGEVQISIWVCLHNWMLEPPFLSELRSSLESSFGIGLMWDQGHSSCISVLSNTPVQVHRSFNSEKWWICTFNALTYKITIVAKWVAFYSNSYAFNIINRVRITMIWPQIKYSGHKRNCSCKWDVLLWLWWWLCKNYGEILQGSLISRKIKDPPSLKMKYVVWR